MSSLHILRDFISERLSAAAAEIFQHFEETVVRYEQELECQRKLLDVCLNPQLQLHKIALPQHYSTAKKDLCDQMRNSSVKNTGPKVSPIETEQQVLCITHGEEQLHLKAETDIAMVTPANKKTENKDTELHTLPQYYSTPKKKLCDQKRPSSEKNGEPKVSLVKMGQQVFCITHGEEQLHLKSETDIAMVTPANDGAKNMDVDLDSKQFLILSFDGTNRESRKESKLTSKDQEDRDHGNTLGKNTSNGTAALGFASPSDSSAPIKLSRRHSKDKLYFCKDCDRVFYRSGCLRRHALVHGGERPFTCKICQKGFIQKSQLLGHMRAHTGERPFQCKICDKRFTLKTYLNGHLICHSGERRYPCKVCGKRFIRSNHLSSHMSTHLEEKSFPCKLCGKAFCERRRLTEHMRIHIRKSCVMDRIGAKS